MLDAGIPKYIIDIYNKIIDTSFGSGGKFIKANLLKGDFIADCLIDNTLEGPYDIPACLYLRERVTGPSCEACES